MITIDGGILEGGGQIIRTAVALAAVSGEPVTIRNIRKNRSIPGLAAQHVAAVKAAAAISNASTEGVVIGSGEITFIPGKPERKQSTIDIGTAGSIPLVLSAWLPLALRTGGSITITGGTEVRAAPTIDYCDCVFLEYLRSHGGRISLEILSRGYFPEGGGIVRVMVEPSRIAPLCTGGSTRTGIISATSGLPEDVASRQAEAVGRMAAESFLQGLSSDLDPHAADQLLPYLALYGGSYGTKELTSHTMTVISLLGHFGHSISVSRKEGCVEVSA